MEINEEDYFAHYGILRKSGRYPWGSGEEKESLGTTFAGSIEMLKQRGLSEAEIARGFGISTKQLRDAKTIEKTAQVQADINMAQRLKDKGYSNVAIGKRMNRGESSIRALLEPGKKDRAQILDSTTSMLKTAVAEKHYVDIGSNVGLHIGVSSTKLSAAVAKLREEGYTVHYVKVEQLGTGHETTLKVLAAPETTSKEVYRNRDQIQQIANYTDDGGRTYDTILPPVSIDPKRVAVRYAEQGGTSADGVVYIRPGVKDTTLGGSRYAQVRVAVGGTHYIKGMAVYKDDLPAGVDLMFNTNKSATGNKLDALKQLSKDPDMPFGAVIDRQIQEVDSDGKKQVTSVMNIVNDEGKWDEWSRTLSSQMLSKQTPALAKSQLDLAFSRKQEEFDEIKNVDNPAVKKKLLEGFADSADSSAVHLKAAALPRQASRVILPVDTLKETEVYAPTFRNGERVALVRYPHGGIFEIPELTVNNRHPDAKKLLGQAEDAIGINSKVAERLSGADFDGDTVLVIPNDDQKVKTEPALAGLKGFDPQRAFPPYEGMTRMSASVKASEMGRISNLITDMTLRGATADEKARAVRHSMVVIDAEKHGLDWKQSAIDNGIAQLKEKYQGGKTNGAATLISRAKSEARVAERKQGFKVDPETGKKLFTETGATYERNGKTIIKTTESTKLAETDDAHTLSSGTPIEKIYADYSNNMKALANTARKESLETKSTPYSSSAAVQYAEQVKTLKAKLDLSLRNSPLERQSQILANAIVTKKKEANPDLSKSDIEKIKQQELLKARNRTGAGKQRIEINPDEWEAIQAGAISTNRLHQILSNADLDKIKELATPKVRLLMTDTKKTQAIAMLRNGYTQAEVADHLGVSVTTLKRSLSESGGA